MDPSGLARAARQCWRGVQRFYEVETVPLCIFFIGFAMLVSVGVASDKTSVLVIAGILAIGYAWRFTELGRFLEDHEDSSAG